MSSNMNEEEYSESNDPSQSEPLSAEEIFELREKALEQEIRSGQKQLKIVARPRFITSKLHSSLDETKETDSSAMSGAGFAPTSVARAAELNQHDGRTMAATAETQKDSKKSNTYQQKVSEYWQSEFGRRRDSIGDSFRTGGDLSESFRSSADTGGKQEDSEKKKSQEYEPTTVALRPKMKANALGLNGKNKDESKHAQVSKGHQRNIAASWESMFNGQSPQLVESQSSGSTITARSRTSFPPVSQQTNAPVRSQSLPSATVGIIDSSIEKQNGKKDRNNTNDSNPACEQPAEGEPKNIQSLISSFEGKKSDNLASDVSSCSPKKNTDDKTKFRYTPRSPVQSQSLVCKMIDGEPLKSRPLSAGKSEKKATSKYSIPVVPRSEKSLLNSPSTKSVRRRLKKMSSSMSSSSEQKECSTELRGRRHSSMDIEEGCEVVQSDAVGSCPSRPDSIQSTPGAFAAEGPGVSNRRDSAVEEVMRALGQLEGELEDEVFQTGLNDGRNSELTAVVRPRDLMGGNGSMHSRSVYSEPLGGGSNHSGVSSVYTGELTSAEMVDDAEIIFEAKDVKKDNLKRNIFIALLVAVVSIVLIVTLSICLTREDPDTRHELCRVPLEEQNVAVRCFCSNNTSTGNFYDSMTDDQMYAYMSQLMFMTQNGVVSEGITVDLIDHDSCDPLNQDLLITAYTSTMEDSPTEFFGRSSDRFRLGLLALIRMYTSMGGVTWTKNNNWLSPEVCDWDGVDCLFVDLIYKFVLPENGLTGTLPTTIGYLDSLRAFDLSMNRDVTGTIPTEIVGMKSLQMLSMSHMALSGTIPSELMYIERLDSVILNRNQLTGSIPTELFHLSNIRFLEVANNHLHGSIPSEIGKAERLTGLVLGGNQFTGSLPQEMEHLEDLELLSIGKNQFTGSIPDFLGHMSRLEMIYLYESGLTGTIPESFCNSTVPRKIVVECAVIKPCSCCSYMDPNAIVSMECYENMKETDGSWLDL